MAILCYVSIAHHAVRRPDLLAAMDLATGRCHSYQVFHDWIARVACGGRRRADPGYNPATVERPRPNRAAGLRHGTKPRSQRLRSSTASCTPAMRLWLMRMVILYRRSLVGGSDYRATDPECIDVDRGPDKGNPPAANDPKARPHLAGAGRIDGRGGRHGANPQHRDGPHTPVSAAVPSVNLTVNSRPDQRS